MSKKKKTFRINISVKAHIIILHSYDDTFRSQLFSSSNTLNCIKYDTITKNSYTVEPLYNGHHWDQRFCPL